MGTTARTRAVSGPSAYGDSDCHICGKRLGNRELDVDHMLPKAMGGTDDPRNLRLAHASCNRSRRDGRIAVQMPLIHDGLVLYRAAIGASLYRSLEGAAKRERITIREVISRRVVERLQGYELRSPPSWRPPPTEGSHWLSVALPTPFVEAASEAGSINYNLAYILGEPCGPRPSGSA